MREMDRIPRDWQEWWAERAAMVEYDAHLTRNTAEAEASRLLLAYLEQRKGA